MNRFVAVVFSLAVGSQLMACGAEGFPEEPVSELGSSEGTPDEFGTMEEALTRPMMRIPFPCGQVWTAETRSGHSPWQAVDFNRTDDLGDEVVASAGGTVTRSESEGNASYGEWIEIDHGHGYRTRYAHLSVRLKFVGQQVGRAEKIGEVGSTGGSSGPHLHYEQLLNGSPIRIRLGDTSVGYFQTRSYRSHNGC